MFPTPSSPDVPNTVAIAAQQTCSQEVIGMAYSPDWAAKNGAVDTTNGVTTFTVKDWGPWWIHIKSNMTVPPMHKGLTYRMSFEVKLSAGKEGASTPTFAKPPAFFMWKENATRWENSYTWPNDYSAERPWDIVGDKNTTMSASEAAGGFTKYSVEWTAAAATPDARQKLWVHMVLADKPRDSKAAYSVRNFCLERVAVELPRPAVVSRYAEKFEFVRPALPSAAELAEQSACPFNEEGLTEWSTLFSDASGTLTLPANTKVVVGAGSFVGGARYEKIVVPETSELVFRDAGITLVVRALVVAGKLRIGSPTCRMEGPIKIVFWGARGDSATHLNGYGSKGLAVVGTGEADIFGRRFAPTWTRLARKARGGDDRVYLQEAVNWYVGQEVVVLTTIPDDTDIDTPNQNEVMTVKAVGDGGRVVQFTSELQHSHYAGTEYQGEVALLSRHVMLEGEPDADGYGGHLVVAGKRGRVSGVASRYMGQTNIMARYPFHFHLIGGGSGSYFSDNVARDTYFRCFTVHGTHDAVITENVAFNATGSCYYVEDGVEENNTFSYNMAAYVKTIGKAASGSSQGGEKVTQDSNPGGLLSGKRLQPADASASGFYFSNAYNSIIGNIASGGWTGFGFPGFPLPIGDHKDDNFEPRARPTKEFRGNTAHSTGWYWGATGAVYVGGVLKYKDSAKTILEWQSGREARNTRLETVPGIAAWKGTPLWMQFNNTLVYASKKGILHWGSRVDIDGFEFHDVGRSVTLFGEAWLGNGIVNGASGNTEAGFADKHHDGFQFYDISVKSVVTGVEFRNYQKATCRNSVTVGSTDWPHDDEKCAATNPGPHFNIIWSGLYHSDEFKPQQISAVNNIKYTNVDRDLLVSLKIVETGASRFFNFIDFDGSATLEGYPTIVGSNKDWWNVCHDCRYESAWQTWLCPKKPAGIEEREVAHIKVLTPDITPGNGGIGKSGVCQAKDTSTQDWSNCNVGYIALWKQGAGDTRTRKAEITQNAGITGVTGTGWYMWLDGGAPKMFTLYPEQVSRSSTLRFATSYPSGTTFTVTAEHEWDSKLNIEPFTLAASVADVVANPVGKYYFDGTHLILRPTLPDKYSDETRFERGGAWVYDRYGPYSIKVVASCDADSKGFCKVKPTQSLPVYDVPCPGTSTRAPPTGIPNIPETPAPPTPAPRTFPPSVPRTDVPATAKPGAQPTSTPDTFPPSVPATDVPATSEPGVPSTSTPGTPTPPRKPSVSWCEENTVCTAHGDTNARCTTTGECSCGDGFAASGAAKVCTAGTEVPTVTPLVSLVWEVDCTRFTPAFVELVREVIVEVLGGRVLSLSLVCGSAAVSGMLEGVSAVTMASADLAQAVADKQASDSRFAGMRDTVGSPTSSTLTSAELCTAGGASVARIDATGTCVAVACHSGHTLANGVCSESDGDSGLGAGVIAAIVVCSVVFIIIVAVVVVCVCMRKKDPPTKTVDNTPHSPDANNEAEMDATPAQPAAV